MAWSAEKGGIFNTTELKRDGTGPSHIFEKKESMLTKRECMQMTGLFYDPQAQIDHLGRFDLAGSFEFQRSRDGAIKQPCPAPQ